MNNNNKIQELRQQIKQLEEQQSQSQIERYSHLIGKCLHRAATSWELITAIDRVEYDEHDGDEITFDCISIYFDDRGDDYNNDCSLSLSSYGQFYIEDLERYEIPKEKFIEIYEKTVGFTRKQINK